MEEALGDEHDVRHLTLLEPAKKLHHAAANGFVRLLKVGDAVFEIGVLFVLRDELLHVAQEGLGVLSAALAQLSTDEIESLNGVGAFVDAEDLGVACVLLDWPILEVARAAVDLNCFFTNAKRFVG